MIKAGFEILKCLNISSKLVVRTLLTEGSGIKISYDGDHQEYDFDLKRIVRKRGIFKGRTLVTANQHPYCERMAAEYKMHFALL